jgi:putative nucleotidyltransferase with HDIG domain
MSQQLIDQIVSKADALPQLPGATSRLIEVINDAGSSFDQIADVIRFDQAITTRVLRVCNSAYFGLQRQITSLEDAARVLGTAKLLQLVMAAHTTALLAPPQAGYGLAPGALWTHSVGVALAAQRLGRSAYTGEEGTLFTAGLLHDMGKLLLNEHVGAEYRRISEIVKAERITFHEAEQRVLGTTHAEVGARVAQRWGLPAAIVDAIRYHHDPNRCPQPSGSVDVVHVADVTCLVLGIGGGDDGTLYRVDPDVLGRLKLQESQVEQLGIDVVLELKLVRENFQIG